MNKMLENCKFKSVADKKAQKGKCKASELMVNFSYSNKKLRDTSEVAFIQWNITAIDNCPWATDMCKKSCYAKKAEKMYPSVAKRRKMHDEVARREDFVEIMTQQIEFELSRKKYQNKTIFFRIHESGDFFSYEYLEKWYHITKKFEGNSRIVFEAYTKSLPLFDMLYKKYGKNSVNIKILSSIWDDTTEKMVELTRKLDLEVYTAIDGKKIDKFLQENPRFQQCKCEECGKCKKCYVENCSLIVAIH